MEEEFLKDPKNIPAMTGIGWGKNVCLIVNKPEEVEEMMLNKNKYFDKHPVSGEILKRTVGDSIVFARSDIKW